MQSNEGQSLAQMLEHLKTTSRWKELDKAVNECYQNTYQNHKLLEVYAALMDDNAWNRQIGVLELCNQPCIPDEMKKKAGIFNARLLQSYAQSKSSKQAIKYYFSILFNFKISCRMKKMFFGSISRFRLVWHEQLGMLLQNALLVLMNLVEKLEEQDKEGMYYEALSVDNLETIYTIQVNWPQQSNEAYESIITLTNLLFQNLDDEEQSYVVELAKILRKTTQLILKDQFFVEKTQLIKDLLDQWIQLVDQDFEFCEDDEREKQKRLQKVIHLVASWEDIYEGMVKILQIYSPSTYHQELDQEIHNYLKLQQNFGNQNYQVLKQKAASVLKILIENNQQQEGYERLGTKYSQRVIWSIIQSLQHIVGSHHLLDLQQQKTCISILELFAEIMFTDVQISDEHIKHLLELILIPLFESYLDDIWGFYEKDIQDFSKRIDDCCQLQLLPFMTSKLAKAIQNLEEYNEQSSNIVNDFVIKSLIANKAQIMQLRNQSQFPQRKIKNTTCFVLLGILCTNAQKLLENIEYLKQIFLIEYIAILSEIEVALIYDFFSYIQLDFFEDCDIVGQIIESTLVENMNPPLRRFAITLLENINLNYFTQNQFFQFLNLYDSIEKKSSLDLVLQNLIIKKASLFTPECFLKIVESCIRSLDREIISINYAVQSQVKYSSQQAFRCIRLCEILAKQQHIVCVDQIVQKLWRMVENIQNVRYISFDDELVKIGSCLLDNTKRLPKDLVVFEKAIQSFKNNGYDGCYYFQFFFKVYQHCNEETLQLAYTIQDLIIEVASIFLFHPNHSELTQENWASLNASLWIAHSMLEQKLSLQMAFWKDIQDNLQRFPLLMQQISLSSALLIRYINLKLAFAHKLRLTGQLKQDPEIFNYELIGDLANRNKIYGYEAKLLVSSLTNLLPEIKCGGHPTIWIIMIYLLRADNLRRSNYQNRRRFDDQDRNFNKILSLIIPSFQLEQTLGQQILSFIETFKRKDMINYLDSLNKLTSQNQAELSSYLKTEISQRVIFKVTEIKTSENQQIPSQNNRQTQKIKSIMRNVDNSDNQLYMLRKRMKNFVIFQREQTQDQSGDQEERKLFRHGQKPLKKLCVDREDIKRMERSLQKKFEFTESKRDLLRQKSMRKKKMRDYQLD